MMRATASCFQRSFAGYIASDIAAVEEWSGLPHVRYRETRGAPHAAGRITTGGAAEAGGRAVVHPPHCPQHRLRQ